MGWFKVRAVNFESRKERFLEDSNDLTLVYIILAVVLVLYLAVFFVSVLFAVSD